MQAIRAHRVRLSEGPLVLRPMTELDWETVLPWNNDPEVLFFWEGDDVTGRPLETVQEMVAICAAAEASADWAFRVENTSATGRAAILGSSGVASAVGIRGENSASSGPLTAASQPLPCGAGSARVTAA